MGRSCNRSSHKRRGQRLSGEWNWWDTSAIILGNGIRKDKIEKLLLSSMLLIVMFFIGCIYTRFK